MQKCFYHFFHVVFILCLGTVYGVICACALLQPSRPDEVLLVRDGNIYVSLRQYHEQLLKDVRSCTFPGNHSSFLFEKCEINGNRYETNRTSLVAFKIWEKTNKQKTSKQTNNICFIKYALLSNARLLTVSGNVATDQEKVDFSLHS